MRSRPLLIAFLAALFCGILHADLPAGRQTVALFPPHALGVEDGTRVSALLGQALADRLRSRFDVHLVTGKEGSDPAERKRKARSLRATYVLTGNVSRIGQTATLDLTLAPTEDPGKGRTVFVTSEGEGAPAPKEQTTGAEDLPPVFRRMADEASAKLTLLFFGDGQIGEGGEKKTIPSLSGKISRSRNIAGKIVSLAKGDVDRNGKPEIAAAYPDAIVIYGLTGEELVEKARIPESRGGLFHVDVADLNRNGIAEVIAVRYLSGRAVSDIWEFDGKEYKRIAANIPYFLRAADMGPEGIVLLGPESDPVTIFKGPVFRMTRERSGSGDMPGRGAP
ncbi:MAG: FG-GAP-like repeat-containing protein, partial [Candidatus Deferrimicrobiaceae bacterium]